jgi:hypothetical protein
LRQISASKHIIAKKEHKMLWLNLKKMQFYSVMKLRFEKSDDRVKQTSIQINQIGHNNKIGKK